MIAFPDSPPTDPDDHESANDPSPDEIMRRAAAIRRGWSIKQRKSRRIESEQNWFPPSVCLADVVVNIASAQAN